MPYAYSDPRCESDPRMLPDMEIWQAPIVLLNACPRCHREEQEAHDIYCIECNQEIGGNNTGKLGWFYAFGQPGCCYDSDVSGPYATEAEAIADARDMAGVECDDKPCGEWRGMQNAGYYGFNEAIQDECTTCGWSRDAHKEGSN